MLAQNLKTAAELGINDVEHGALVTVLGMLERGELVHGKYPIAKMFGRAPNEFNMAATLDVEPDCGTIACLCGWAHLVSDRKAFALFFERTPGDDFDAVYPMSAPLRRLFGIGARWGSLHNRMPEHAAIALRSYLTTGEANWSEALRDGMAPLTTDNRDFSTR